jgi:hypothetical protein
MGTCLDLNENSLSSAVARTDGVLDVEASSVGSNGLDSAMAVAQFSNTIHLSGAAPGAVLAIGEQFLVNGSLTGEISFVNTFFEIDGDVVGGSDNYIDGRQGNGGTQQINISLGSPTVMVVFDNNGNATLSMRYFLSATTAPPCLNVCLGESNFSDTGQAVQTLPPGITFTSDSGDFLTPTPEPSSSLLFLSTTALVVIVKMFKSYRRKTKLVRQV